MKRLYTIFLLLLLPWWNSLSAQSFTQERYVDKKELKECIKTLSSPEFEGRGTGEPGQRKAALYISDEFKKSGVSPFTESSFLNEFPVYIRYRSECYVKHGKDVFRDFEQMFAMGVRCEEDEEVEKEVIFGGDGDTTLLNEMNIKGKIVAIFLPNLRNTTAISSYLLRKKAYGVFYANPYNPSQFGSICQTSKNHTLARQYSLNPVEQTINFSINSLEYTPYLAAAHLKEFCFKASDIAQLLESSLATLKKAARYGVIEKIPVVQVRLFCQRIKKCEKIANVTGIIRAQHGTDSTIVVTAHYDHLGQKNGTIYPGADDNASGVAAMLNILKNRMLDTIKPAYNIIFAAVTGEEVGFLGSNYFLDSTTIGLKIIANVNLDMLGRSDRNLTDTKKLLYAIGDIDAPIFNKTLKELSPKYALSINNCPYQALSDHVVFMKRKIPVLFLFSGTHADLHQPTDVWTGIDYEQLTIRTEFAAELLYKFSMQH